MSLPLAYRPEVRQDIDDAYSWYERQRAGLGEEFLSTLRDLLEGIEQNPESHGVVYRQVRAAVLRRFPYVVYYRVEENRTLVLAVVHGSRNPRVWKTRSNQPDPSDN